MLTDKEIWTVVNQKYKCQHFPTANNQVTKHRVEMKNLEMRNLHVSNSIEHFC